MSVELRCPQHPRRKYLAAPKTGSCPPCEDIYHIISEKRGLPYCWAFDVVLGRLHVAACRAQECEGDVHVCKHFHGALFGS